MSDAARDYFKQWLSPGVLMGLILWLLSVSGAWFRLESLENKFVQLSADVRASTQADQEAAKETVRYQEKVANLIARIESLERFREAQSDYNASTMSTLAVLKKGS